MGKTTDDAAATFAAWIVTTFLVVVVGAGLGIFVHPIAGIIGAVVVLVIMTGLIKGYYKGKR